MSSSSFSAILFADKNSAEFLRVLQHSSDFEKNRIKITVVHRTKHMLRNWNEMPETQLSKSSKVGDAIQSMAG